MNYPVLAVLVGALSGGCAMAPASDKQPAQPGLAAAAPSCVTQNQCEAMWSTARRGIINTCRYPLKTQTDRLLETYNTVENAVPRSVSSALACRVTKEPRPEGGYSLVLAATCSAVAPPALRCFPPVSEAIASFTKALTAVAARVKD